jgi:hypothetical protein
MRRRGERCERGGTADHQGQEDDEDSHERNATPIRDEEADLHGLFFANQGVTSISWVR